ncbi:four helix bundle protein [Mucilaginibacter gotjawali]|jgi:four helix bundle protein|uniref:Four helix bundle protein n=1 Tax=Mucilaginibacter gotjawali TaxID=1550579 RepID=A0A839S8Y6_9SPHI|nr:four helix bundle protein [Mucilaginibacter gotjawali]MBB3054445.1 four helix bundle protein [Mucilaginibacter gotjawali]HWZ04379.1 four helix bundle protein [Mucilaginibacter sp.]
MGTYRDLVLYKKSFVLAMEIFVVTKQFPKEETYSLTDQIRRSSRSTNICTIEAYRKRKYPNHFVSKLTDVDMENSETQGWLEFAKECNYISIEVYNKLHGLSDEIGRLVQYMIDNPGKFGAG